MSKQKRMDYLVSHINFENSKSASEFCKLAQTVYEIWKTGGKQELSDYLLNTIGCSEEHAEKIARNYHPEYPPVEICPIDSINQGSDQIFQDMALYIENIWPHNLLAWYLKRYAYGSEAFDFKLIGDGENDNTILFPNFIKAPDGNHLPFGLAALNIIEVGELPAHVFRKAQILLDKLCKDQGIDLAKTLLKADLIFPPTKILEQLIEVIKRGLKGETIIIAGAFCPDYTYEETGRKDIPYRYTFDRVGEGVGLVAQQFQRVLPHLVDFFTRQGITYQIRLGIGDFEANSEKILRKVGVEREEFVNRCKKSLENFKKTLPNFEIDLRLFEREWANGRWTKYVEEARVRLSKFDFGQMKINTGKDPRHEIRFIARDGQHFYRRWFDDLEMPLEEIEMRITEQLAEYATVGRIIGEDFKNQPFIYLAGDRPKIQIGGNMYSDHPILCCRRVY